MNSSEWTYCAEQRSLQPYLLPIQQFSRSAFGSICIHLAYTLFGNLDFQWFGSPQMTRHRPPEAFCKNASCRSAAWVAALKRNLVEVCFVCFLFPVFLRLRCYQCRFKGSLLRFTFFVWALFSDLLLFLSFLPFSFLWQKQVLEVMFTEAMRARFSKPRCS